MKKAKATKTTKVNKILETLCICVAIIAGMLMIVTHGTQAIPEATVVIVSAIGWAIIDTIEK